MDENKSNHETLEVELSVQINEAGYDDEPIRTVLDTDERVIARITDGIYRKPESALRELISNAYDADATRVTIQTDYPRFEKITIRDNGIGMGADALANMVKHIGGSAKRSDIGREMGITDPTNSDLTKSGRKIIGKIGIGLFSVAQLTQRFQIITKEKNKDYRLVADVLLNIYSETENDNPETGHFESGVVQIKKVRALDIESQGTDIILMNLRPSAVDILKSSDVWNKIAEIENETEKLQYTPSYHIGCYMPDESENWLEKHAMRLPWTEDEKDDSKIDKIYRALLNEINVSRSNPSLDNTFDNYFRMIWSLALSTPLPYIHKHPFLLDGNDEPKYYKISNNRKEMAEEIKDISSGYKALDDCMYPTDDPLGMFDVAIDDIHLKRPIAFDKQPISKNSLKVPLMFYGKYSPKLDGHDIKMTGGELEIEGYFYWNSKILPIDHNGILIRINNASGTMHEKSFMSYPVAEKTTLGQITAEIFVVKGLDPALNIDRESFNYSHPHYQLLMKWVHNALRQVTSKQKQLRSEANKEIKHTEHIETIKEIISLSNEQISEDSDSDFPEILDTKDEINTKRNEGAVCYVKSRIFTAEIDDINEWKIKSIIRLLDSKSMFDGMSYEEQEEVIKKITDIMIFNGKK